MPGKPTGAKERKKGLRGTRRIQLMAVSGASNVLGSITGIAGNKPPGAPFWGARSRGYGPAGRPPQGRHEEIGNRLSGLLPPRTRCMRLSAAGPWWPAKGCLTSSRSNGSRSAVAEKNMQSARFQARGPIVSFGLSQVPPNHVARKLAEEAGTGVRHGCFCAHILVGHLRCFPGWSASAWAWKTMKAAWIIRCARWAESPADPAPSWTGWPPRRTREHRTGSAARPKPG